MSKSEQSPAPLRFSLQLVPSVTFLRYPATTAPAEGTMGIVTGDDWQTGGLFRDGEWRTMRGRPFKRPVRYWTIMEESKRG